MSVTVKEKRSTSCAPLWKKALLRQDTWDDKVVRTLCVQPTVNQMNTVRFFFSAGGIPRCYLLVTTSVLCSAWDCMGRHTSSGVYWDGAVSSSLFRAVSDVVQPTIILVIQGDAITDLIVGKD